MLCAKAPKTLRGKDNCCASYSNCWGKIFHLSDADSQRFGFKTKVCLCLKHYEEKTPANSACCFPKRSDSDKCSGCLVICPQRLVTVFETISPPKTSSSKICHGHLKTAENDDRIIGNKYYSSARKVSSREDFIAWVIPVSFPSQLRAELHRFPGLLSLLLPATTFPKRNKGSTNRYPRLGWTPEDVRGIETGKQTSEGK